MATFDVLMPVLNAVRFLGEAIDSIRNQTFSDWRLLILDHGSQDGSTELAHRYADLDSRIKIFSFSEADGLAELLNLGLDQCDCKYVVRQDADDISLPNRMSIVSDLFDENPECLVIGGHVFFIDEAGQQIEYRKLPTSPRAITAAGFFYNPMAHSALSINFSALKRHGATYGKDILKAVPAAQSIAIKRHAEDYFLFGQLALLGSCVNADVPFIKYRRHGGGVGALNAAQQIETALQISRFLANSFCVMRDVQTFDPGLFCNHADHIFDFHLKDYTAEFEQMAVSLRRGLGQSVELERELAFRWVLATRNSGRMASRYLRFDWKYAAAPNEWRTVRNWLLRGVRKGRYVYRANRGTATSAKFR
jgi:glycosyltransferase involved in cell wall biosynthesis